AAQASPGPVGVWAPAAGADPAAPLVPLPPPGDLGHGRGRRRAPPGHGRRRPGPGRGPAADRRGRGRRVMGSLSHQPFPAGDGTRATGPDGRPDPAPSSPASPAPGSVSRLDRITL